MDTERQLVSSGSPYEPRVGFSRAVRLGPMACVAGTASMGPAGELIGRGDAGAQARRCLQVIEESLASLGMRLEHVIRTRIMLADINDWEPVALVHGEYFGQIRPASTIVEVSRFINPEWLVELEADAFAYS